MRRTDHQPLNALELDAVYHWQSLFTDVHDVCSHQYREKRMLVAEVRDTVLKGLSEMLGESGFVLKKSERCLIRKTKSGKQKISVAVLNYNPSYTISVFAATRIDAIENLLAVNNDIPTKDESYNIVTKLDYFLPEPVKRVRFEVETKEEIRQALESIGPTLREQLIPLLDKCDDLQLVEKLINWSPPGFAATGYPIRAELGVVAAHLANPSQFEEVVRKYEREMTDLNIVPLYVKSVRKMVEYLRRLRSENQTH
jgi:hypothetical protein